MDNTLIYRSLILGLLLLSAMIFSMRKQRALSLRTILIIAIVVRLGTIVLFLDAKNYDTLSYALIGKYVRTGTSIYPDIAYKHHPYLPAMLFLEALDVHATTYGLSPTTILKSVFSAFDLFVVYCIFLLSTQTHALIYALHPSMILLSGAHGQIESIPFAGILLSLYFAKNKRLWFSGFALAFAVLVKTWPAIFLGIFIKHTRRILPYISVGIVPGIAVFLYAYIYDARVWDILHPVVTYRGVFGYYGLGIFLSAIVPHTYGMQLTAVKILTTATIIALFLYSCRLKRSNILQSVFLYVLLICLLVVSGANPLWLLPFVILLRPIGWRWWLILIGLQSILEIPLIQIGNARFPWYESIRVAYLVLGALLYILELRMLVRIMRPRALSARGTQSLQDP